MRFIKTIFSLLLVVLFSSCAHSIHQVHVSDFNLAENMNTEKNVKIEMGKIIQSKAEQFVILGFVGQTDYVDQAYAGLLQQCSGSVTGITTQLSSSMSFFSWKNKALMQGLCLNK